jgi:ABC-type amino acid transport substrate-binding protein
VPTAPFIRESLVLAVRKGEHADVVTRLNADLAAIRANGTLQQILKKWNVEEPAA